VGFIEDIVEIVAKNGLVHLNYAHLLSRFLPVAINLNPILFSEKVWVNAEFFHSHEPFEKAFYFSDEANGEPLSVTLDTHFSHL
jgi:hypothetical protein